MTARERVHFQSLLQRERARIATTMRRISATMLTADYDEPGAPGDDAPAGVAGVGHEDDLALAAREAVALAAVDSALLMLTETPDRYGRCIVCGRTIPAERLELVPTTRHCGNHADWS